MPQTSTCERFSFQADTREVLRLTVQSLYTDRDIFLRELVSNASDALDRLRFESQLDPNLIDGVAGGAIRLTIDSASRTLTIEDDGIGMSRDEVVANLGTIARSGTRELRARLGPGPAASDDFIGRFGVGFYSAFMVADKVTVLTRRAGEPDATRWESTGEDGFTIEAADKPRHGTTITLHLTAPDADAGLQDYAARWRIADIVKRYSDFIMYPIYLRDGSAGADDKTPLNMMKPIWKRSPAEVRERDYHEFYRHVSDDWTDPLATVHLKAEGTFEYDALVFVPAHASYDLYYPSPDVGLQLFAKRVKVADKCRDLLPAYLRFVRGVVDVGDLPLNISRQRLQQDHHTTLIRKRLTRRVVAALQAMRRNDYEKYVSLWKEFGRAIKEAFTTGVDERDPLVPLLLFHSSHDPDGWTDLAGYVSRMAAEQQQIFYLTGESRATIERSPHLETLRERGIEVLYMTDPVDELLVQHYPDFEGKPFKSAAKGEIAIDGKTEMPVELRALAGFLERYLASGVTRVRVSERLTKSPACLVVEDHQFSPVLERALQHGGSLHQRRTLELNPTHPLIAGLRERHARDGDEDVSVKAAADVIFGLALLAEGSPLPDDGLFGRAAADLAMAALSAPAPVVAVA
jgi:molecular chaperone HtpG